MSGETHDGAQKLGTFIGVFTPTLLTILGVIMYLRIGWVVGNAGWLGALSIVVLANSITFATSLSMSALATNMRVGVGGAYFLISRSFGLEVGGAIGIPLYLSQVLSVALYAYGLAEITTLLVELPPWVIKLLACAIIVGVTAVAARSTELALKAQIPLMVWIAVSVAALAWGTPWSEVQVPAVGPWADGVGYWEVFAVFFPAVTGVLTGLSLSGDLEDPSRSIPRGVITAVLIGAATYLLIPVALAFAVPGEILRADSMVWTRIAVGGAWVVVPAMAGAVLSSAFGSILSAPRTLQALATDALAPGRFAEVDSQTGEPLQGVWLSGALALAVAVLLPDLNAVASTVTVFFLTTYGALNAVALLEVVIGDPSFRPRIPVSWVVGLFGAIACFATMFLINPAACAIAIAFELGIGVYLSQRSLESTWGDARSGLLLTGARFALLRLRDSRVDPRNWRPHVLVVTTDLAVDLPVVALAAQVGQHRGIVTVVNLLKGDLEAGGTDALHALDAMRDQLRVAGLEVFPEVVLTEDPERSIELVVQANGMAGLQSNTVILGLPRDERPERLVRLLELTRRLTGIRKSTLLYFPTEPEVPGGPIVVWWSGKQDNGDLMLLLAHLLTLTVAWRRRTIVLKSVAHDEADVRERRAELARLVAEVRIEVQTDVIVQGEGRSVAAHIAEHSQGAALVMLGLDSPAPGEEAAFAHRTLAMVGSLPPTLLVRNAGEFRGRLL